MTTSDTPEFRYRLPSRRAHCKIHIDFAHDDHTAAKRIHIHAGYDPRAMSGPRVLEVFLRGKGKIGTEADFLYDDIAVLLSTALQYGLTPRGIRNHLGSPQQDGDATYRPMSLIAAVADELIKIQDELMSEWTTARAARLTTAAGVGPSAEQPLTAHGAGHGDQHRSTNSDTTAE